MELTGLSKDHNAADSELKIILSPIKKEKYKRYISGMPRLVFV